MGMSVNFLESRSTNSIRKEINNITNSYNNPWDYLCELLQNSFDAIVRYNKKYGAKKHIIEIVINVAKRSILVKDSGIGIESDIVQDIVAPNGTDKEDEMDSIGEKGVGLTYTIFSCNRFAISTQTSNNHFEGEILHASAWRHKHTDEVPELIILKKEELSDNDKTFTSVLLEDVEPFEPYEDDLFCQTAGVIEYIIRTKTVVGFLKKVYGEDQPDIEVKYTFIDDNGAESIRDIDFGYMLPSEFLSANALIDFDSFKEKAATYTDKQKTQKLQGKGLYKTGYVTKNNRRINYYCFFAPSRNLWKDMGEKNELYMGNDKEQGNLVSGGIYVATKGMPTGIILEPPTTGFSGYWNNFLMLIEDDKIVFDLGRKTIPSRTKGVIKEIAKSLFQEFLPYIKYVTSDPSVANRINSTVQQATKTNTYDKMKGFADLKIDKIPYQKHPNSQEAAVVSIFHELLGAGILKGYYSLSTGYKQTYDLWTTYRISTQEIGENLRGITENDAIEIPCVIEFKYKAEDLIKDLSSDIKFFNDMDLLVCWDYDEQVFAANSVEVEQLPKEDVLFYGSNYKLSWPGSYDLGAASEKPVLVLRKFLEDYKQNNS